MIRNVRAIANSAGLTLQSLAAIVVSLLLALMTVEGVAARQPDAGRSSGPAAASSQDPRMIERAYGTHLSANRSHRKMVRPVHPRLRMHASKGTQPSKVGAELSQTSVVRRYDRPSSYFLHGARF